MVLARKKNFALSVGVTGKKEPLALLGYYKTVNEKLGIKLGARVGALADISEKKLRAYGGIGLTMGF